jgi:hypothetical protein
VHFYAVFKGDSLFNQKLEYVASMVTLQLNDGAPLFVLYSGAIAAPCFLE